MGDGLFSLMTCCVAEQPQPAVSFPLLLKGGIGVDVGYVGTCIVILSVYLYFIFTLCAFMALRRI